MTDGLVVRSAGCPLVKSAVSHIGCPFTRFLFVGLPFGPEVLLARFGCVDMSCHPVAAGTPSSLAACVFVSRKLLVRQRVIVLLGARVVVFVLGVHFSCFLEL